MGPKRVITRRDFLRGTVYAAMTGSAGFGASGKIEARREWPPPQRSGQIRLDGRGVDLAFHALF